MTTNSKAVEDVIRELKEFAKSNGLVVANSDCLVRHAQSVLELGRCPCVDDRTECPCGDALADIERLGRCECGILIDPVRLCLLKSQDTSRSER